MTVAGRDLMAEEARREEAADWLLRLDRPDLPEQEMHAWLEWFGASEENRRAFEEMQSLYRCMRALPDDYREKLHALIEREEIGPAPAGGRASRSFTQFLPMAIAAGIAVLAIGAAVVVNVSTRFGAEQPIVYAAPADRHRTVRLDDGSALALAADTVVAVNFSPALRAVELERGQTYFEVQKDVERPFVVHAGDVRVTAIGTAFNVARSDQAVTVTVTEGAVEVARIVVGNEVSTPVRVSVGERKVVALNGPEATDTRAQQLASRAAWANGRAEFTEATLAEVLPLVNEYAPRTIVIDDPRVADLVYSGTILREHVGEWVASLPKIFPVRPVALEDGTTTLVMDHSQR